MTKTNYILITIFCLVLVLPIINATLDIWKFENRDENRNLAEKPVLNINNLDNFPDSFENYFNDHFSFRAPLLDIYHKAKLHVFKVPANEVKSIEGKAGWYFLAGKEKRIFEGKMDLTDKQYFDLIHEWQIRTAYFDSLGIPFYWIIAPMKHYIYEEFLPPRVFMSKKKRRIKSVADTLNKTIRPFVTDATDILLRAKKSGKIYYQLDNHWNFNGAFPVGKDFIERLSLKFPQLPSSDAFEFRWKDSIITNGFHLISLGLWDKKEITQRPFAVASGVKEVEKFGFPITKGFPYPPEFELHFKNSRDKTGLKLLLIRDSFGDAIIPYLNEYFSETLIIFDGWRLGRNKKIIETFKPDIVLYLGLETHFENLIREYED